MGSSQLSKEIYDTIRNKWVEATPEEIVRQKMLCYMIDELGYPMHLIAVEKELSKLPRLSTQHQRMPRRRIDILCFERHVLTPLVLIECKAVPIQEKMLPQIFGYNAFVRAPFMCLVNDKQIIFSRVDRETQRRSYHDGLPPFEQLTCLQAKPSHAI